MITKWELPKKLIYFVDGTSLDFEHYKYFCPLTDILGDGLTGGGCHGWLRWWGIGGTAIYDDGKWFCNHFRLVKLGRISSLEMNCCAWSNL